MRIKIDDDTSGAYDLKWRGLASVCLMGNLVEPLRKNGGLPGSSRKICYRIEIVRWKAGQRRDSSIIRVMMEPIGTDVFFVAPEINTSKAMYRIIAIDAGGAVFNRDSEHPVTVYEAESDIAVHLQPTN